MDIAVENVVKLGYESISCEPISAATAALSAAKVAADEARKTHVQLEQELPNAHLQDATDDERLIAEGKPRLKGRPATATAEKGIQAAEHEAIVCRLAAERAETELAAALDEHGEAWAEEVAQSTEKLRVQWEDAVQGLIDLHGRLASAVAVARAIGVQVPPVAACAFSRKQIGNCEFAAPQAPAPAFIGTGDVLAALASVIEPTTDEKAPVTHPPLKGSSPNRDRGDVEDEIAARQSFDAHAQTPEGQAERQAAIDARRERAARNRAGRDEALAATLQG